jgi:hypothetical protein
LRAKHFTNIAGLPAQNVTFDRRDAHVRQAKTPMPSNLRVRHARVAL